MSPVRTKTFHPEGAKRDGRPKRAIRKLPVRSKASKNIPPRTSGGQIDPLLLNSLYCPLSSRLKQRIEVAVDAVFLGKRTLKACGGETVHRDDVDHFNKLAEGPLSMALARVRAAGLSDLAHLLLELYPVFLPYQIAGIGAGHFPHHAAYVMDHLAVILYGEGASARDFRIGMIAALCHDTGLSRSETRKITEQEIKRCLSEGYARDAAQGPTPKEVEELWQAAVRSRIDHARHGAAIAETILHEFAKEERWALSAADIDPILELVLHHDDPKIPALDRLFRESLGEKWLKENVLPSAWFADHSNICGLIPHDQMLLHWHYEADALWMLTKDGIAADLMRPPFSKRVTFLEMLENNIEQHRKMVQTYRALLADNPSKFEQYRFIADTHYRSHTGYALFRHLEQQAREWAVESARYACEVRTLLA
jgi:hypothetical protein